MIAVRRLIVNRGLAADLASAVQGVGVLGFCDRPGVGGADVNDSTRDHIVMLTTCERGITLTFVFTGSGYHAG